MRLVVLMIEVEQPEGISARKLILETARHNVITAYNGRVGLELLRRFPKVDVVVVHTELVSSPFEEIVHEIKAMSPNMPVIAISPISHRQSEEADYLISSYDPQELLTLLAERFEASVSDEGQ